MEITVRVPLGPDRVAVLGAAERNLKMIRESLGVNVAARDELIRISGEGASVSAARATLERLLDAATDGSPMPRDRVLDTIADEAERWSAWADPASGPPGGDLPGRPGAVPKRAADAPGFRDAGPGEAHAGGQNGGDEIRVEDLSGPRPEAPAWDGRLNVHAAGRPVRAKTENQQAYLDAIRDHDLVFGIGPAGTGKTFLAVAAAVHLLKTGRVQRVVLARPAVEAGERLGFLPGDLQEKVNPYLRPLLDALQDMVDVNTMRRFMDNDVIEVSPLAFMRGRTLNSAVIILDEAQNTTRGQMKMFLTRIGQGSRAIVTGDTTQIDLPDPRESGLIDAARRLSRVRGVSFCQLTGKDVVRHTLVQRIIEAYGDSPDRPAPHGVEIERALGGDGSVTDEVTDGVTGDMSDGGNDG